MDMDGSLAAASPAPSASLAQPTKRGARGPYKKDIGNTTSECVDTDGRLPGSKDGLGSFPPGSDWAKLMLALKLKGRRADYFRVSHS
jgi:bromodomain-containing protein 7